MSNIEKITNINEIYKGMHVHVFPTDRFETATYVSHGWDKNMNRYLGTIQVIKAVGDDYVTFDGDDYTWDYKDLAHPEAITQDITLKGEKETFDVKEL